VIFAFVLTALATPPLFAASDAVYLRLRGLLDRVGVRSRGTRAEDEREAPARLVLLGFHRVASAVVADLERLDPDLLAQTLVVDINTANHERLRARGVHVVYGDVASTEVLRHAGVDQAEVIVSTVPDTLLKGTSNALIVRRVRELAPRATIIANCSQVSEAAALREAGADHVYRGPTEVALGILPAIRASLARRAAGVSGRPARRARQARGARRGDGLVARRPKLSVAAIVRRGRSRTVRP
jgi:voltage-gated potassium channel Kch